MKNLVVFASICVAIILGGIFLFTKKDNIQNQNKPTVTQYFWSQTCPHCKNVADFMESWDKKDKFQYEKFEINESSQNTDKFIAAGSFCKIPRSQLGVPLMITTDGLCLTGDTSIIDYLKNLEL